MKWEEIYDRSKAIVRQVTGRVLGEEFPEKTEESEELQDIVTHLQDSEYLVGELKKRERYDYEQAFLDLKRNERRRGHLRILAMASSAACILIAMTVFVMLRDQADNQPAELATSEMLPLRGMKAILLKANGEELQLGEYRFRTEGDNGAVLAADSSGLQYEVSDNTATGMPVYNTLTVPRGGMYQLTLSDGTKVWLNSDSRLIYPVAFTGEVRDVTLMGEAYFEVKRDELKPFIVRTYLGQVKVLGTQFNVKIYPEEASVITTLVQGSVNFSNEAMAETRLLPGDQLVYEQGDSVAHLRTVNVNHYVGWRDNQLSFQGETLEDIMRILARWYDVEVVFEDEGLKQIEFSGNLDKYEHIGKFFKLFELGADVQFLIDDKVIRVRKKK